MQRGLVGSEMCIRDRYLSKAFNLCSICKSTYPPATDLYVSLLNKYLQLYTKVDFIKPKHLLELMESIKKDLKEESLEKIQAALQFFTETEAAIKFKASSDSRYKELIVP
eukprot:TRINITY_DN1527_c0_g1_i4.p1 TRINITY_DN1527_c0_g1~~TRINITY_DN1527_c0_g1_i4.p1  ORF type:complete len:110 (-),score=32.59 TRINITY_DN1527_c0_g1_i4:30-359(-)